MTNQKLLKAVKPKRSKREFDGNKDSLGEPSGKRKKQEDNLVDLIISFKAMSITNSFVVDLDELQNELQDWHL